MLIIGGPNVSNTVSSIIQKSS